jgi:mRNA interferase MazF
MKRSEIWLINLDPTIGAEIRKTRPAVIVNDDALGVLPLKIIVPITDWKPNYAIADWMVKLEPDTTNHLTKDPAADCFQVRSLSQLRMVRKIGNVDTLKMSEIEDALARVLKIR